jgi:hypothetical protein
VKEMDYRPSREGGMTTSVQPDEEDGMIHF